MDGEALVFWIVALGLAALAAGYLLRTLLRAAPEGEAAARYDLAVYRDQLAEIERDLARGLISEPDAERARVEISRRVLEADRALAEGTEADAAPRLASRIAAGTAALALLAGSAWIYGRLGAPGYPDLPLDARLKIAEEVRATRPSQAEEEAALGPPVLRQDVDPEYMALIERLRQVVAERPDDRQGLALLARHEAGIGNYPAAHAAQAAMIAAKGGEATSTDFADLAQLLILAADGFVSPEAEAALTRALERDPRNPVARYYSGLLFAQTGRPDLAFRFWAALLTEGPPDAPWIAPIRAQIADVAYRAGEHDFVLPPAAAPRGPSEADIAAAAGMSEAERTEMIRGMVAGLAERLASDGGPAADWARLIRAYGVLGELENAEPVVAEALAAFAGDAAALAEIEAAARDAGVAE